MPVTASNRRRTNRRPPTASPFQAPLMTQPEQERPTDHQGIPVVKEEALRSPLPGAGEFRISKLYLANDTVAYACRDCLETANTRGEVMAHRNQEHGSRYGKKTPRVIPVKDRDVLDVVLPPRPDGNPAPSTLMELTLGELLALAPSLKALGDLIEQLERERDEAAGERLSRADRHKIEIYESHQAEIVELRAVKARTANYEEIRQEVADLRAWKKKITAKLHSVGFHLEEE